MRKLLCLLLCFLLLCPAALGEVERDPLLDTAFTMLEAGNEFLERYNALTGAEVKPWFENGLPYFFGGTSATLLFSEYPRMRKRVGETDTLYYRAGTVYLYGFDCTGYIRWICDENGLERPGPLSQVIISYLEYRDHYIYTTNSHIDRPQPAWEEIASTLSVGNLFIFKKPSGFHVMMYIGTLRDYGYTAEELPALAEYLDHPLVIHCGPSPVYGERYRKYFETDPEYFKSCTETDGGVQISLLGIPADRVPYYEKVQKQDHRYFLLPSGQVITVISLDGVTSSCWYRLSPK